MEAQLDRRMGRNDRMIVIGHPLPLQEHVHVLRADRKHAAKAKVERNQRLGRIPLECPLRIGVQIPAVVKVKHDKGL